MAFENLLGKASELLQTGVAKGKVWTDVGVAKAKEVAEIGKLKVDNATELENIKKTYLEIGKRYYEVFGDTPAADFADLCEKINASKAKVAYNNQRIADIKAAGELSDEEIEDFDDVMTESVVTEADLADQADSVGETDAAEEETVSAEDFDEADVVMHTSEQTEESPTYEENQNW